MINWHRLFGIFLTDYFTDTPYTVELEKDLSLQQQFLDVVILHKEQGDFQGTLPDGFDNLKTHNLVSYKSMQESFDFWAIEELIGYYVNYRKQISKNLLPESDFALYAISTRFPQKLSKQTKLNTLSQGVYELQYLKKIRLIVLTQIPETAHNAVWHLFSHNQKHIRFGAKHYHTKMPLSTAVNLLYERYQLEGLIMPYTMEDFQKDVVREHLHFLNVDEIVKQLPADEVAKQLSPSERLKGLSKEEIEVYLNQLNKQESDSKH